MSISQFLQRFPEVQTLDAGSHKIPVSITTLPEIKEPLSILFPFPKGVISVKGKDHIEFLQNVLTNDVQLLPVGKGVRSLLVNTKGHILFDLFLYKKEGEVLIFTDPGTEDDCKKQIEFFKVTEEAEFEIQAEPVGVYALIQPEPVGLPAEIQERLLYSRSEGQVRFFMDDGTKEFEEMLLDLAQPVGLDLFEQFRPLFGLSRSGADFNVQMTPHEASLKDAVSFNKGCYVGQEPISRIHFRGHPSKKLVVLSSETPLNAENPILSDEMKAGGVTTASQLSLGGRYYSLGYVPYKLLMDEAPAELTCGGAVLQVVSKIDE